MSTSRVFTICFILYQAQGAPQYLSFAWLHPSSMMNMQIRPNPNFHPTLQESSYPTQDPEMGVSMNRPSMNDEDYSSLYDADGIEPEPVEYRRRQGFGQQCDPRKLFLRSTCINSTWVRTCSFGGTFRDLECPNNFSCLTTLGICVPQLSRRLRTFSCPDDAGVYPDPRNCMVYHECLQGNATAPNSVTCYWPQIYDPLTQSCQMESSERPCYKINCVGQQTVAYPGDPNIYANCTRGGTVQTLNRCEFGLGWIDQTQQCERFYCTKEGNIPASEPYQYYTCSRIFKRMIRSELKTCSEDGTLLFNSTLGICAPPSEPQAKTSSQIVETLYHEVPNVDNLVRTAQDSGMSEISPKSSGVRMDENQEYLFPAQQYPHPLSNGMPMSMMHDHAGHGPPLPPGMPFPNMMPFIM